jgi:hypothetical protein
MGLVDQSNDALKSSSLLAKVNMSGKPDGFLYRMFSLMSLRKLNLRKEGGRNRPSMKSSKSNTKIAVVTK